MRPNQAENGYECRIEPGATLRHLPGQRSLAARHDLAVAGEGRNAWRDLWLKLPGESRFVPAIRLRCEQKRAAATAVVPASSEAANAAPPPPPADSLNAAALTMAEALKTTLALMERAGAHPMPAHERRVTAARRGSDILAGECAFD